MFTGIVEELGAVREVRDGGLVIAASRALEGTKLGDSIGVNGTCLSVTAFGADWFSVDTVPETLRRTNLGLLRPGSPVNLERSLRAGDRMGGHYVQGHVEATGTVRAVEPDGDAVMVAIEAPRELLRRMVPKGFVAIDGISLTVVDRTSDAFRVTLIPLTRTLTTAGAWEAETIVNLESDVLVRAVFSRLEEMELSAAAQLELMGGGRA